MCHPLLVWAGWRRYPWCLKTTSTKSVTNNKTNQSIINIRMDVVIYQYTYNILKKFFWSNSIICVCYLSVRAVLLLPETQLMTSIKAAIIRHFQSVWSGSVLDWLGSHLDQSHHTYGTVVFKHSSISRTEYDLFSKQGQKAHRCSNYSIAIPMVGSIPNLMGLVGSVLC